MNEIEAVYLLYQKDFTEAGTDRYFIYDQSSFCEVGSKDILNLGCRIITHDYWLIASSLFKSHKALPRNVLDVVLLAKIVSGKKSQPGDVQDWDIQKTVAPLYAQEEDFHKYIRAYYRREVLNIDTYMLFSHKLAEYTGKLIQTSQDCGEWARFTDIELPIHNRLMLAACNGIRVDRSKLRNHKLNLKSQFYTELKAFAEKHGVFYQMPAPGDIKEKLASLGYSLAGYTLDTIIDLLPSADGYTDDLRNLQDINENYRLFNSISSARSRVTPIPETHWTSTGRIYQKAPLLQNISKRYRDIFIPDDGYELCYIDYDQFEVGIMAAITGDPKLSEIYKNEDAYLNLANIVFSDEKMRKKAKILFLSYTYGMSLENIMTSVKQFGGDAQKAKAYFSDFAVFEKWKDSIYQEFREHGRIATICGNNLNRSSNGDLSHKEKRSAVNHVIQGSASYIFKKALLSLSAVEGVQILIPMHDAVLFQHTTDVQPDKLIEIFENIMTEVLEGKVKGKASIEAFFEE